MPTELEELVGFLHHGNTEIRQIAAQNLVGYTESQPSIFKINQLEPIKDLKLLVKDYTPISKRALTMLINLSEDKEVLDLLATDDAFLESLLLRITRKEEPTADDCAMLLANLAKSDTTKRLQSLKRAIPEPLSKSALAIDQLLDCFVKGADGSYNKDANYDYLSYVFADLAKHPECQTYLATPAAHDDAIIPLTKLTPFTEHASAIRRRGVASCLKNTAFHVPAHPTLLAPSPAGAGILPYLLLPLMGPEAYSDADTDAMLDDLQLLGPDKRREPEPAVLATLLDALLLLATTRPGRDALRHAGAYPVVRECHLAVDDDAVREACDRLVQLVMRDEEGEGEGGQGDGDGGDGGKVSELADDEEQQDEDEQVIEVL